jgi:DNA-binding GntR family transcriptional regulator
MDTHLAITDFTSQDRFDVRVQRPLAIELAPFLEREIITRRLQPGEKLVELDLCARFGVSRSPVREALRLLEASLLVTRKPRYGVRVAPMTVENLNHVYACRAPLEALAASSVASAPWRLEAADALGVWLKRMQDAAEAGNVEDCFFANVALTDVLHDQCRNPVLTALLAQVNKAALRYRHWAFCQAPSMIALSIGANRDMVEAIRLGSAARAEAVTKDLVQEAWKLARQAFAEGV